MKKIILIFLFFFSLIGVTNALPIPALVLGYEFFLLAIPAVFGFFGIVYFYFQKYVFWINIYLFCLVCILYGIHFFVTKEVFFFELEWMIFPICGIIFLFLYKCSGLKILHYFFIIIFLFLNFFLIKINYQLYTFANIAQCVENAHDNSIKIVYKDNFLAFYATGGYLVIEKGGVKGYKKKGVYALYYHNTHGKIIGDIAYNCIK